MDILFLEKYINMVIVGICLCIGYILKTSFKKIDNKYIPSILFLIGILLACMEKQTINLNILLSGGFSGLTSTGCYELFKNTFLKGVDTNEM